MKAEEIKKLPFWETVGRSFKYVLKNRKLLKVGALVVLFMTIFQIALSFPLLCAIDTTQCQTGTKNTLSIIAVALVSIGIIINYCRSIILKAPIDFISWNFWKRMFKYILTSILLSLFVSLPTIIVMIFLVALSVPDSFLYVSMFGLLICFSIFFAPVFLIFPAISVDDKETSGIKAVYLLANGNKMAIFFGQFILMMPYWIISSMYSMFYNMFDINSYIAELISCVVVILLGLLDAAFKGAFFAHIYQFFTYYNKKKNK